MSGLKYLSSLLLRPPCFLALPLQWTAVCSAVFPHVLVPYGVTASNRVGASPSNHRVLLFQNASGQFPSPAAELPNDRKCPVCVGQANVVLGQPDFTTTTENISANRSSLRLPTAVASDGVHVVVA